MTIKLKRNDTEFVICYTINGCDLTGASVRFIMGTDETLIVAAEATIVQAEKGRIEYVLNETDTSTAGTFYAEFEVTFGNGKINTYPQDEYLQINILPNLDSSKSTAIEERISLKLSLIEEFKTEVNTKLNQSASTVDSLSGHVTQLENDVGELHRTWGRFHRFPSIFHTRSTCICLSIKKPLKKVRT